MKVNFDYDKEKDVWCLLNKGKSSNNNINPTKVYELLVSKYGENPSEEMASIYIDEYLLENAGQTEMYIQKYIQEWSLIADEYHKRAMTIFRVSLPHDVTAYLTINNRNPYSITDNLFFVSFPRDTVNKTIMHELWHFYTWYGLGADQEEKLGKQKYNDLKEALTVLLNEEYADLLPEGIFDVGYPQHQKLREEIKSMRNQQKDIRSIWKQLASKDFLLGVG